MAETDTSAQTDAILSKDHKVSSGTRLIQSQDLAAALEVEKYRDQKAISGEVGANPFSALRFSRLRPPGAG